MENRYKIGEIVFATTHPKIMLIVRRYLDRIYYCTPKGVKNGMDILYFEIELESPV